MMLMKPELLAFHFIWNHPVAFRDFFIPQAWNRKLPYKTRLYQQPTALSKTKIQKTGRGIGKSIDLEMSILHMALLKPGEETIITSFRRVHIKDRCEAIIKYYITIPYLKNFVDWKHINRTPIYTIPLINGNTIYGACVDTASLITDPRTGKLIPLKECVRGQNIQQYTLSGKLAETKIADLAITGDRPVVKITTASGRSIKVTPDHQVLTDDGWLPASQCYGARLAVAARTEIPLESVILPDEEIDLLAILLAEGSIASSVPEFTKRDKKVINAAQVAATALGFNMTHINSKTEPGRYTLGPRRKVWKWCDLRGLDRVTAHYKSIPSSVFQLDCHGLQRFFRMLWMTDGYVNPMNGPGLHMSAEKVVRQTQYLLLRLGIQSSVRYQANSQGQPAWDLRVYSRCWDSFSKQISLWGDRCTKLDRLLLKRHRCNGSGWPRGNVVFNVLLPAWEAMSKRSKEKQLQPLTVTRASGIRSATPKRRRGPERLQWMQTANPERIIEWAVATGCQNHQKVKLWTSTDLWWDPVVSIIDDGQCQVGDLYVPPDANFLIQDIVVHNSVGDDPNAVAIIGKHPSTRAIDEMEVFPRTAWTQFIEARAERGSDDIFVGVPNGIIGMPFTDIQKNESYANCFFRISRMNTPFWDQKRKQDAIAFCGPELSDNFKQQIHGEDGSPVQGVWPIETIMRQMSKKRQLYVKDITADDYKGNTPEGVLYDLPYNADPVVIGIDVGYTEPTVICIFVRVPDRDGNYKYRLIARVNLKNKMIFRDQEEIIDYICQYFNTQYTGIDASILPDEFVLVKINNKIKYVRVEQLDLIDLSSLEVPTFENGKTIWKKAKIVRHYYNGGVSSIKVAPGCYTVKVTDNHSVMVYNKNGLEKKLISQLLEKEDFLLSPKKIQLNNQYQILKYKTRDVNQFIKGKYKEIKLDEDLGYFLGWCVAEGSSKVKSYQLSLGDEEETAKELLDLARKLFNFNSGYIQKLTPEYKNSHAHNKTAYVNCYPIILGGGKNLKDFIISLVGNGCRNKKIPEQVFNSPESVQRAFIKGLMLGDGYRRENKEGNIENALKTTSEELAKGFITLLQMLGIYATYKIENTKFGSCFSVNWCDRQNLGRWEGIPLPLLGKTQNTCYKKIFSYKQIEHDSYKKDKRELFAKLRSYNWCFKKIKQIEKSTYSGIVYDFEVEDNHTFVAGVGNLLVHNTGSDGREIVDTLQNPKDKYAINGYQDKMIGVYFNKKVIKAYMPDGTEVEEDTKVFATIQLIKMFVNEEFELPYDEDILEEFSQERKKKTESARVIYTSTTTDHIISAFRCFAIARYTKELLQLPDTNRDYALPVWGEGVIYGS